MVTPLIGTHEGVSCDGCSVTAFVGNRYKCLRCSDYDLCFACFTSKNYGDQAAAGDVSIHDETHPMQMILSSIDFELVYEGDPTRRYDERKIVSFTCPYCNITGLTDRQFGNHVTSVHPQPPGFTVICPVCIGIADMEHSHSRETDDLCKHWAEHHSISTDPTFRAEPTTTRPAQRRPMLARRTQGRTAVRAAAPRATDELGADMAEIIRTIRPDPARIEAADEFRRMAEILNAPALARQAHRLMAGFERTPVVVESAPALREPESVVQQVIRPFTTVLIYPPTSDESGDETPQPAPDSADESEEASDIEELVDETPVVEDDELRSNEFWKTLKERVGPEEAALILNAMKTAGKMKEEKEEKIPVWTPRPLKSTPVIVPTATPADADGEQGWLPLSFETTPIRSTGCGGYWSDKRFLRPRKMQREQSVASSNAEIMEKAEVAMALCRASCAHDIVFSDPSKPDIALREALKNLNLGAHPDKMMEYKAPEELIQVPERDPITTGEEAFEMPDFTAYGYGQIIDGNAPLGVVPEADEAITNSEDEGGESSGEDEDEQEEDEEEEEGESRNSSIPEELSIP